MPISFSGGSYLRFPPDSYSVRWYETYFGSQSWIDATLLSILVGTVATILSVALGFLFGGSRDGRGGLGVLGTLFAMIVAPLAAMLVQMAISRSREYQADRMGAMISGNPLWLASALRKISVLAKRVQNPNAEMFPAAAPLFIVNPLSGRGVDNWFSTHPNPENRIAELEAMAQEMGITSSSTETLPPAGGTDDGSVWVAGRRYRQGETRGPWQS